jgi:hypothetical protein
MDVIAERDRPWVMLFTAQTLEAAAGCVAAQPDRSGLVVSVNVDGFTRALDENDRRRLARPLASRSPARARGFGSPVGAGACANGPRQRRLRPR